MGDGDRGTDRPGCLLVEHRELVGQVTPDELRSLADEATPGPWRVDPASLEHNDPADAKPEWYGIAAGKQTWHNNQGLFHPTNARYDVNELHPVIIGYDRDYYNAISGIEQEADARLIALAPDLARLCAELWEVAWNARGAFEQHANEADYRGEAWEQLDLALAKLAELETVT